MKGQQAGSMGGMVSFYFLSLLLNTLVSSINGRKQRQLSQQMTEKQLEAQRNNLMLQLEHQSLLHQEGYKQQTANQLRTFHLTTTWPLNTAPTQIADLIQASGNSNMPMYVVIAPVGNSGIQKETADIWNDLGGFLSTSFPANSDTPVILGKYKSNWPANPLQDYTTIWGGGEGNSHALYRTIINGTGRDLGVLYYILGH